MEIRQIPVRHILPDPDQPRRQLNEESLQGLADSIRQHGLLSPITVVPAEEENKYTILTGERRWRAVSSLGNEFISCIVKNSSEDTRLTEQLIENLQREDLQPLEKAQAIKIISKNLNLTNREVARRLGMSERTVGYLLDLLDLPEEIGQAVISSPNRPSDGQITEKHARFLKQLNSEPELQSAVVDKVRQEKLSGEATGKVVRALKHNPDDRDEILESATDHLSRFFEKDTTDEHSEDYALPVKEAPSARRILDVLSQISIYQPEQMPVQEVRQLQDALISLQLATESLISQCRRKLGE